MGCGIALWLLTVVLLSEANGPLSTVIFWIGAIGFGSAYWQRSAPERAAAERKREQDELNRAMRGWHTYPLVPAGDHARYRPAPADRAPDGGRSAHIALRPAVLRTGRTVALPDPDGARRLLAETVTLLARAVSAEARQLAGRARALPDGGCTAAAFRPRGGRLGWQPEETGSRPTDAAADLIRRVRAWSAARHSVLTVLHPAADALARVERTTSEAVNWLDHPSSDLAYAGPLHLPVRPAPDWPRLLRELEDLLGRAADRLDGSDPVEPGPPVGPPRDARFEAHVSPSAIDERLTGFLVARTRRFAALATGAADPDAADRDLGGELLTGFLTTEVSRRFEQLTEGARRMGQWPAGTVTHDAHRRLHLAYTALALNYLKEVSDRMQEYTDRSGMGEPRPPVTFNGHVGQVNIADTIQIIGANVAAIMARGDDRSVAAIDALSSAIQQEAALTQEQRAELLDNLADVSEAAADPADRRLRSRARLALEAIARAGAAIGATSPIAQAVTDWQHVWTTLF
ncbi:hypothetical protein ACIRBX_18245 [Kitasatospora sp. NPDC096147]|uniref:hypothetical protein n=1 Tax=Kitasatospora sp. NPDC096147 TaxID=3364093 RepID=UPI00380F92DB